MARRFKILITCIVMSIFSGIFTLNAQLLQDTTTLNLIKKDIDCIYNLQYNKAYELNSKIIKLYPRHPVEFLLRGILTYWKNYPMLYTNPERISFEEDMRQCIRLSEKNKNKVYKAEYLLTNLCARGMLLKFYDDNNLTMKVLPLVASTYKYLRQSFSYAGVCTDLYYYTGVYNYYREAYPKVNPAYKPLALLFPSGDIKNGIKQINDAALNAVILRGESYYLLTTIYLNFENKYQQALHYSKSLYEMYPDNGVFFAFYVKNLLLLKQYDEAEKLINTFQKETENKYFQVQILILKGILQEKKYHDNFLAQQYYNSGINRISVYGEYGHEYAAYAYFGLSRISYIKSENNTGKKLRDLAMKLGDVKNINFDN